LHDPAIAIVDSKGEVVFAEGAERYLQSKRAIGSPPDDMFFVDKLIERYCEPGAEIVIARSWLPWVPGTNVLDPAEDLPGPIRDNIERLGIDIDAVDSEGMKYFVSFFRWAMEWGFTRNTASTNLRSHLRERPNASQSMRPGTDLCYDHHLTHAATAAYSSPFEDAVVAVFDANGEGMRANSFFHYTKGRVEPIPVPENAYGSLGLFYIFLCVACRFDHIKGEEWKVMGLAPYGRLDPELYDLMRPMLEHQPLGLSFSRDFMSRLTQLFQRKRAAGSDPRVAADLAFTGQRLFSEWSKLMLDDLYALGLSKNLIVAGGCGLNSSWNGRILKETKFDKLHVFAAPGDDGNAVGAALLAYYEDHPPKAAPARTMTPYLGSSMSQETLKLVTTLGCFKNALPAGSTVAQYTAQLLAAGKIVGWAQGRAEFGPRALGNRSILADPRDAAMKDHINARVKFREEYRPFAPSILDEFGAEYFENYEAAPYMERTLRFRPEVMAKVPAVVHEDGTGRLQTVRREWNPRYHELVTEFHKLTGVPIILNTSFNVMGKPIIHSVEDAFAVFCTSGLDALVIEDFVFLKD
jgi:carbamoyltransferase